MGMRQGALHGLKYTGQHTVLRGIDTDLGRSGLRCTNIYMLADWD